MCTARVNLAQGSAKIYIYIYIYILSHDWKGNTGEYSSSRVAVLARLQGGTIIFLCFVRPKRNAIIDLLYDSNLVGEKIGRGEEKEKKKKGERVRAPVAGEARTRAPLLARTALCPIRPPRLERKASSKRAHNCHGNQENAVLPCNTASYCPPIDQSDCNMTFSHMIGRAI